PEQREAARPPQRKLPGANPVQGRLDFARSLLPAIPIVVVERTTHLSVTAGHMHCGAPYIVRGRQGSCSCASQTSSGSSARTRSWPSVCGSSSSPNQTATSPPTTTGLPPPSPTTPPSPSTSP